MDHRQLHIIVINNNKYMSRSGGKSNCYDLDCLQKCCNYYGNCPMTQYSSSYLSECYYYYQNTNGTLADGEIAGVVVGSIIGFVILVLVIACCIKARRRQQQMKMAIASQNNAAIHHQNTSINYLGAPAYQQPQYAMPNNQPVLIPYGQPYAQPYVQGYGQQVYPPVYKGADYGVNPIIR